MDPRNRVGGAETSYRTQVRVHVGNEIVELMGIVGTI